MSEELPDLVRLIELPDMVAYAGATWDWHRLHYDPEFLRLQGLDKAVVDGQVIGAFLAEQVLDHFGPSAFVTALRFRLTAMVFAGETIRVTASTGSVESGQVAVEQLVFVGDRLCASGTTTVRLS